MSARVRVLVVDDEPDMCWALESILRLAGYAVTTALSGAQALAVVQQTAFPVAFLDAKLPDMDGRDLAMQVRRISPGTAIVLVSGYYYSEDAYVADGLRKGLFVAFLAKPFDLRQVRQTIQRAMEICHG